MNGAHTGPALRMQAKDGRGEVWIYDVIGEDWLGCISGRAFVRELRAMGDVSEIVVHINSPGGSVHDGTAIYNSLKEHSAKVTVKIEGAALSAASLVAMAGDTIHMAENAMLMIHDPWIFAMGSAEDLLQVAAMMGKYETTSAGTYAARTGQKQKQIEEWMHAETWFTAAEAKEAGFIDVIDKNKTKTSQQSGSQALSAWDAHVMDRFQKRPAQFALAMLPLPAAINPTDEESDMDLRTLKEKHPDLVQQIEASAAEKTLQELSAKDDAQQQAAQVAQAREESAAVERKRQSDIRALCAQARAGDKVADGYCNDPNATVETVRAALFNTLCAQNPPPSEGNGDPGAKADPDAEYRKEYAAAAADLSAIGVTETAFINSRRKDDGKPPLETKAA